LLAIEHLDAIQILKWSLTSASPEMRRITDIRYGVRDLIGPARAESQAPVGLLVHLPSEFFWKSWHLILAARVSSVAVGFFGCACARSAGVTSGDDVSLEWSKLPQSYSSPLCRTT